MANLHTLSLPAASLTGAAPLPTKEWREKGKNSKRDRPVYPHSPHRPSPAGQDSPDASLPASAAPPRAVLPTSAVRRNSSCCLTVPLVGEQLGYAPYPTSDMVRSAAFEDRNQSSPGELEDWMDGGRLDGRRSSSLASNWRWSI